MTDLISRQDAIDAIVKLTNCNTSDDLREYVAEHSLWSQWSGGVLEALEAVEGLSSALPCPEGFDPEHLTEQDKKDILEALDWVKGTITEEVPSAQPEHASSKQVTGKLDLINRQDAVDAIEQMQMPIMRSEFPEEQYVFKGMSEALRAIKDLPSAQPEERTEERTETHACDCISRQAVIDMIMGQPPEAHYPSWYAEQIKALPPAPLYTPDELQTMQDLEWAQMEKMYELGKAERKKGKWIDDGTELGCCCSECGATLDDYFYGALYEVRLCKMPKFCPNCGCQMNGGEQG